MPQKYRRRFQPPVGNRRIPVVHGPRVRRPLDPIWLVNDAIVRSRRRAVKDRFRKVVRRVIDMNRRMSWMRNRFGSVYNYVQARQMRP